MYFFENNEDHSHFLTRAYLNIQILSLLTNHKFCNTPKFLYDPNSSSISSVLKVNLILIVCFLFYIFEPFNEFFTYLEQMIMWYNKDKESFQYLSLSLKEWTWMTN